MAIDPVCGMTVDEARAAGKAAYGGQTYYFCSAKCLNKFQAAPAAFVNAEAPSLKMAVGQSHVHAPGMAAAPPKTKSAKDLAKDPICGMVVEKATALKTERAGRTYYFCSSGCQRTFESPEAELKSMKTRVTIALTGVLALAMLRAAAFLFLAAGATIVRWAPIPALPGV